MLSTISIKNFAIIKELNVDLKAGLNIITGETGAGKSIIIEAISMALGSRADTTYVRTGEDKAEITLVVDTDDCDLDAFLEEAGIPNDNPMVIKREISASGKSICRINGSIVPLSALNGLCKKVADIHGQYDQQLLLDPDNHINILDSFGGNELSLAKDKVKNTYEEYAAYSKKLYELKQSLSESERQRDFLKYELKEITDAKLILGEDDDLEASIKLMENSEKLYESLSIAHSELFGSDRSVDSLLGNALRSLESISGISKDIDDIISRVSDAYYEIGDLNSELRSLRDGSNFSPAELDEAIERLEVIKKIKRKYGGSIESALEYANKAKNSLDNIENADEEIKSLEKKISDSKQRFDKEADILTSLRKKTAKVLNDSIGKELSELNFNNARFEAAFEKSSSTANGVDKVEFLISTNLGESLKPLVKVASGGELSRVMLAFKRILGDTDKVPTMIFDEIDTGISGATAAVVGEKLDSIGESHQVICITHLPQIASRGRSHYRINKVSDEISTHTTVVPLSSEERIEELARMISGTQISNSARIQAKELLGINE